ncbi:Abhydrolase-3 domain-containing protein [Fusarium falciforme]|uniref:Abhydrolase-3 domain-containing protein n=1 Tax=Fusarium falciforme TaxID=195108 RepID=UPI0023003E5A|nr:Abhydrolase-3 domain-containing protein [Fusarium falciforme]WAO96525.1 Abhydrolase-3 domain-containing protein [Fusarium falciforme]
MSGLKFDPEYLKAIEPFMSGPQPPQQSNDIYGRRATMNMIMTAANDFAPAPPAVPQTVYIVRGHDEVDIKVTRFATEAASKSERPTPAVVYLHGGGFFSNSVEIFTPRIARYAHDSDLPYFAHLSESSQEFNIDPTKIIVHGDSAGGGVAAGAALLARDRKLEPPLAKQILIYPMLDDRTKVKDDDPSIELMVWKPDANVVAWDAYLSEARKNSDILPYAVPARAASLRGLPPTYIEVGALDLFRDEDIEYASRLAREDVEVEFHLWPGLPHGFDGFLNLSWYERAKESRMSALKRA